MKQTWLHVPVAVDPPFLAVFRNNFDVPEPTRLHLTYSADERCVLFLDGEIVARGPERGTVQEWLSAELDVPVSSGRHCLVAAVFAFGKTMTAYGQMSSAFGFFCQEHSALLGRPWESRLAFGCAFLNVKTDWAAYPHILTDEDFEDQIFSGAGEDWLPAATVEDQRTMHPGTLPAMRDEEVSGVERHGDFFAFPDYGLYYGDYTFSGTGEVRLRWAEAGFDGESDPEALRKLHKPGDLFGSFSGPGDRFRVSGKPFRWRDFYWHAGRTLEMTFYGDVRLDKVSFRRTGYPYKLQVPLSVPGDAAMTRLLEKSWKTIENCSFETLMDCPYYEQLQYISDSRNDLWCIEAVSGDLRLVEKALRQWMQGQSSDGWISCRYPTREAAEYQPELGELYRIHIPSFTALWIGLVHDYVLLRPDSPLIAELVDSARRASNYLAGCLDANGLLQVPGWNFIDWLSHWKAGFPPECDNGTGATLNLMYLSALENLTDLLTFLGRDDARERTLAQKLETAIRRTYWSEEKQAFAENASRTYFSEHAQVWALIALRERRVIDFLTHANADECGIAFNFYYLAAAKEFQLDALFEARKRKYLDTAASPLRLTMPELFPNDWWMRSDCHAWGAHFLHWQFGKKSIFDRLVH
ncbi:MAG: hypothetical protein PHS41_13565 [Victivallaceae bacterium]|nr:hypothetical protein [Victivallaceae bacterium]